MRNAVIISIKGIDIGGILLQWSSNLGEVIFECRHTWPEEMKRIENEFNVCRTVCVCAFPIE